MNQVAIRWSVETILSFSIVGKKIDIRWFSNLLTYTMLLISLLVPFSKSLSYTPPPSVILSHAMSDLSWSLGLCPMSLWSFSCLSQSIPCLCKSQTLSEMNDIVCHFSSPPCTVPDQWRSLVFFPITLPRKAIAKERRGNPSPCKQSRGGTQDLWTTGSQRQCTTRLELCTPMNKVHKTLFLFLSVWISDEDGGPRSEGTPAWVICPVWGQCYVPSSHHLHHLHPIDLGKQTTRLWESSWWSDIKKL